MNTGTIWRFICPCGREHEYKRPLVPVGLLDDARRELAQAIEWGNSSEHPNWEAGWNAGYQRGRNEAVGSRPSIHNEESSDAA